MIQKILNFNKDDCKHFSWVFSRACCGQGTTKSGACQIPAANGARVNKVCSMTMPYCRYEKQEEDV